MCNILIKAFIIAVLTTPLHSVQAQTEPKDTTGAANDMPEEEIVEDKLYLRQETRFSKGIYQLLFREPTGSQLRIKTPASNHDLASRDGLIIRNIEFRKMDIFAPSVLDTLHEPASKVEKMLNAMHNDTRPKLLRRHLLIKQGDQLDVFRVMDNERIIRDLPYINDARFLARPIPGNPDSVDMLVLTQDVFPFGFDALISRSNAGSVSIWNSNLFGYGHQAIITLFWDGDQKPALGYGLSYGVENIAGSFVSAKLEYIDRWNQNSILFNVLRDFRSTSFKNAGGILFENTEILKDIELIDTVMPQIRLKYTNTDLWAGRMIKFRNNASRMSSGLFVTGRFNLYKNHSGPQTSENYLYPYQDKTLLLFAGGYSGRSYKKDNLIYTFGRTEDVPIGKFFEITTGVEMGQYTTRYYLAASAAAGRYLTSSGYLYVMAKYGTFFSQGVTEQGALQLRLQYFSKLHRNKYFRFRNFVNFNYIDGINRFEGEFTSLEGNGGITGLRSMSLRGTDKLSMNLESVIFSPFTLLGFHFAFFGALDLGLISADHQLLQDPELYSGMRFGVRIRNDQLVFNTLEFSFSFYPGMPADARANYVSVGSLTRLRFNDFYPRKPETVRYQ